MNRYQPLLTPFTFKLRHYTMAALADLGSMPSTSVANDVLSAAARAATDAPHFHAVLAAASAAERHGVGISTETWAALLTAAERRTDLDTAFGQGKGAYCRYSSPLHQP